MRLLTLAMLLSGCGKSFCPIEYKVNGEWRECSYFSSSDCGVDLLCGESYISCASGVESRTQSCR